MRCTVWKQRPVESSLVSKLEESETSLTLRDSAGKDLRDRS